ncbi:MAG: hypothetical protein IMZ53_02915 [Thermoplasmata archaeon]|nr:hypothetical protein [Thermoplasmata archaeon]
MSELSSKFSLYDILTRVARLGSCAYYGSSGQEKAMPPIDVHDLELCKETIYDGIKQFIADAPSSGWRWMRRILSVTVTGTRVTGTADAADSTSITDLTLATAYDADNDLNGWYIYVLTGTGAGSFAVVTDYTALTGKVDVADWLDAYGNAGGTDPAATSTFAITPVETVAGDISRYPLPEYFYGSVDGKIEYAEDSNHGTKIEWRDESFIRARRSISIPTGYPMYAAIRRYEPVVGTLGSKRRYEIIFDTTPSDTDVLEFPYTITFDKLYAETGLGDSGGDTTLVDAARTEGNDYFNGWVCRIISGTGKGSYAIVTDYTGSSGTFAVADWLTAAGAAGGTNPGANSVYYVEPLNNLHPAGEKYDQVILSSCLGRAEMEFNDAPGQFSSRYLQKDLPKAYELNYREVPRKLGKIVRPGSTGMPGRVWNNITQV